VNTDSTETNASTNGSVVIDCKLDQVFYGAFLAVRDSHVQIERGKITGFIGPSGCGKSTVLRSLNRMNDLIHGFRFEGHVQFHGRNVYERTIDPVAVRRYIGMVFQQPNPFSMSIFDNVAFGLRLNRFKGNVPERVEKALRQAALWDEVKDKLKNSGLSLSGGQQQRLCIARALAIKPKILLMDEPASALDPIATQRIEELIYELRSTYTIIIVTHNMQQAARVSDMTALFWLGKLIEFERTEKIFTNPTEKLTEDYVTGRFG
jgi:phosphate transport system ATP-binding protein